MQIEFTAKSYGALAISRGLVSTLLAFAFSLAASRRWCELRDNEAANAGANEEEGKQKKEQQKRERQRQVAAL